MGSVTVIGTGNIGSAVARIATRGGAHVQVLDRDAEKAHTLAAQVGGTSGTVGDEVMGEVVVLAVPFPAVGELAAAQRDQLDGRILVDVSNPVDFATFDGLVVPADSSSAAQLAAALPSARVVKAFNTTLAATLDSGEVGGVPVTVILAGDDDGAKAQVRAFVEAGGLAVADAGGLKRARELEALGFLQMVLAVRGQVTWAGGFAVRA